LAWRRCGFEGGTAFGPAHHKERRVGVHPGKRNRRSRADNAPGYEPQTEEELQAWWDAHITEVKERLKARSENKNAGSEYGQRGFRLNAGAQKIELDTVGRDRLAKLLGMLGSNHDNEVLNAARAAENLRRKLGLTWDELLIAGSDAELDLVA
jgi:hypothetical protein